MADSGENGIVGGGGQFADLRATGLPGITHARYRRGGVFFERGQYYATLLIEIGLRCGSTTLFRTGDRVAGDELTDLVTKMETILEQVKFEINQLKGNK